MRAPERQLAAFLSGRLAVLVEDVDVAPAWARIAQQPSRGQRHEQAAAEVVLAIGEGEPPGRGDFTWGLPGAHRGAPEAEAFPVAVTAPELARPRIGVPPGVD